MAVCNNTGMVAIFNPSKNLFLSPMADGPIKFIGNLENKDIRIENITKFGRSFSVIAIPYSMKLLIQELQTMNVQMRIITENNIEQLENMSYSKNIEKLIFVDKLDTKLIVNTINNSLIKTGEQINKNINVDSPFVTKIVDTVTDIFQPKSPEDLPPVEENLKQLPESWIKQFSQKYNQYYYFNQDTGETQWEKPEEYNETPKYASPEESKSPETKSPEDLPPISPTELLTQQAQQYNKGEQVYLAGDSLPGRIWTVFSVGDRMITIDTDNLEGLATGEERKVVTATEIYKTKDYPGEQSTIGGRINPHPLPPLPDMFTNMPPLPYHYDGTSPSINFAPTFKIMNGGNDFSSDANSNANSEPNTNNNTNNDLIGGFDINSNETNNTGNNSGIDNNVIQEGGKKIEAEKPGFFDFSKLLIKKLL